MRKIAAFHCAIRPSVQTGCVVELFRAVSVPLLGMTHIIEDSSIEEVMQKRKKANP